MWFEKLFSCTENTILVIFGFTFLLQLPYYLLFFLRLALYKTNGNKGVEPVSVVICARNEEKNLQNNLPFFLTQNHKNYEVIVVNDASWDATGEVLEVMSKQYPQLQTATINESEHYNGSKKMALSLGIKKAKNDNILLTDADCIPASENWITEMTAGLREKEVVLGYGGMVKEKSIINYLIRYDTFQVAMQYLSYALAGVPYMGVGRNLAYKKSLFMQKNGFKNHYHLKSGDDDLFINNVAQKSNTCISIAKEAHTYSRSKHSFLEWLKQKRRHFTTAPRYRIRHKMLLSILPIVTIVFFVAFVFLVSCSQYWIIALSILGVRWLMQIIIYNGVINKLGGNDLLIALPLLEIVFLLLNPFIYLSNILVKQVTWKN